VCPVCTVTADATVREGSATTKSPFGRVAKAVKHYSIVTQPNHLQTVIADVDVDGDQHLVKFSRYYDNAQFWTVPGERDERLQRRNGDRHRARTRQYDSTTSLDPYEERNLAHPASPTTVRVRCRARCSRSDRATRRQAFDTVEVGEVGLPRTWGLADHPLTMCVGCRGSGT
jgi:hypothetical protein